MKQFWKIKKDKALTPLSTGNQIRMQIAHRTGIGNRDTQQDSFGISDYTDAALTSHRGFLFVLADGMGGMQFGEEASQKAVEVFQEAFTEKWQPYEPYYFLLSTAYEANEKVKEIVGEHNKGGTTLIAAHLQDQLLHFVSVGDSRIALYRGGRLLTLNRAHVFGNTLDLDYARGNSTIEEAYENEQRGSLTSFIGASRLKEIDYITTPIRLHAGDGILLMSDGVFRTLQDAEIEKALATPDAEEALDEIEAGIRRRALEGQDNFTMVYCRIS